VSLKQYLSNRCLYWPRISGSNNQITLAAGARLFGYVEIRGEDNRVVLAEGASFSGRIFVKGKGLTLSIGANTSLRQAYILVQEGADLTIGTDCLFSRDVEIRTSDAHSLVDAATGKRLNKSAPVVIGDHVWVGARSFINKGSVIPSNSVVGAMSFVNKAFEQPGTLLAGVPAKIVREGIDWHRERRNRFPGAED
jgi:acetyltransferase-like isoleucine patch superfamily enzyme